MPVAPDEPAYPVEAVDAIALAEQFSGLAQDAAHVCAADKVALVDFRAHLAIIRSDGMRIAVEIWLRDRPATSTKWCNPRTRKRPPRRGRPAVPQLRLRRLLTVRCGDRGIKMGGDFRSRVAEYFAQNQDGPL